ncbi:hypothetical protein [Bradyrhizobium sp.]|uniref:hypothetical protein n=1 Tax=Bradyrhizobium sp. TaxID=376 RepID=UPI001DDE9668|nr:hypothetical protein [Bradyrhizobium sp.]MBV8697483.1 hypothetical protein [Bradyrhizobium sp.]MBV8923222.1 hypothetical protein [Bradyrhizobium sp.]MBV9983954.1 hypothetical protein [Bradyrhizobium sp.]
MALDWIAGHKPQAGHEAEFQEIVATLFWDKLGTADRAAASRTGRNRLPRALFGRTSAVRQPSEALRQRYDEIGILASDTLGMARSGDDARDGRAAALSFRAQGLAATTAIIGDHLLRACYEVKYAPDLSAFGNALLVRAGAFAKVKGLDVPDVPPADPVSVEGQLHIVDAAGRWCRFWGERGHLLVPSF